MSQQAYVEPQDDAGVMALRQRLQTRLAGVPLLTAPADIAPYCRDWHGDVQSAAVAVLRPGTTAEVSACIRICNELGLRVVPQGGNTGLVLGATPDSPASQVVLTLERMNRIRRVDQDDFSMVADAGCVLAALKEEAQRHGMFFPLSLGAEGSCHIGGNVSTNAGGINVLRYGMTRDLVLGLEVVLPDGSVLDLLRTLRKDNRGIDLKQLFIGAEGTLGVVTGVALKLFPHPEQVETALLGLRSLDDAIALYRRARHDCCDLMSAFEFMPPTAFRLAMEAMPDLVMPLQGEYPAYVLMEIAGSGLVDIHGLMEGFLEGVLADELVLDGVVASSQSQSATLWRFREGMNEGQAMRGLHLRTDVSVALSLLAPFVHEAQAALIRELPQCEAVAYGHVGDGNVHLNVLPPAAADSAERKRLIGRAKAIINACVERHGGSFSAEHGIGRLKRPEFEACLSPTQTKVLHALRAALDPQGRMNPDCQLPGVAPAPDRAGAQVGTPVQP